MNWSELVRKLHFVCGAHNLCNVHKDKCEDKGACICGNHELKECPVSKTRFVENNDEVNSLRIFGALSGHKVGAFLVPFFADKDKVNAWCDEQKTDRFTEEEWKWLPKIIRPSVYGVYSFTKLSLQEREKREKEYEQLKQKLAYSFKGTIGNMVQDAIKKGEKKPKMGEEYEKFISELKNGDVLFEGEKGFDEMAEMNAEFKGKVVCIKIINVREDGIDNAMCVDQVEVPDLTKKSKHGNLLNRILDNNIQITTQLDKATNKIQMLVPVPLKDYKNTLNTLNVASDFWNSMGGNKNDTKIQVSVDIPQFAYDDDQNKDKIDQLLKQVDEMNKNQGSEDNV